MEQDMFGLWKDRSGGVLSLRTFLSPTYCLVLSTTSHKFFLGFSEWSRASV
jgi:hypothetical protein